jgi:soluble lytic murein transglycosylase-like protein
MALKLPNWSTRTWLIVGGGTATALALAAVYRREIVYAGGVVLDAAKKEIFKLVIPSAAQPYGDIILQVAEEQAIDPLLIVAIVQREDPWWDPYIVSGDGGHGLMQITSDRAWIASSNWSDPYTNMTKGVQMLKENLAYFARKGLVGSDQLRAALAAYNHGPRAVWLNISSNDQFIGMAAVDRGTTNNYSAGVYGTLANLTADFQARVTGAAYLT